jgi:hypothetical protein
METLEQVYNEIKGCRRIECIVLDDQVIPQKQGTTKTV